MVITFDPAKRDKMLNERGLDFADAEHVFAGPKFQFVDDRHVFSMRKANAKEQRRYQTRLD